MMTRFPWVKNYFLPVAAALLLGFASACETTGDKKPTDIRSNKSKKDKEATTLRLHLEVNADGTAYNSPVPVYREHPVMVNVNKEAFLNEGDVLEAAVVETLGGFAISVQFDPHGMLVLDTVTTTYRGSRIAIFSHFGAAQDGKARWLAAPQLSRRISDGLLTFTPDATREEAERIVRGLNNIAIELRKQPKSKSKKTKAKEA